MKVMTTLEWYNQSSVEIVTRVIEKQKIEEKNTDFEFSDQMVLAADVSSYLIL